MIVADTNLVAYLLIDGVHTAAAKAVWERDPQWMLPPIWRSEFLNVLTTSVRANVMTLDQAHATWQLAVTVFGENEVEVSGDDVLDQAAVLKLSAYDAEFAVVALQLQVPLVTSDRRLLAALPGLALEPGLFGG